MCLLWNAETLVCSSFNYENAPSKKQNNVDHCRKQSHPNWKTIISTLDPIFTYMQFRTLCFKQSIVCCSKLVPQSDRPAQLIIRKFSNSKFRHVDSTACFLSAIFPNQMQRHWPTEAVGHEEYSCISIFLRLATLVSACHKVAESCNLEVFFLFWFALCNYVT